MARMGEVEKASGLVLKTSFWGVSPRKRKSHQETSDNASSKRNKTERTEDIPVVKILRTLIIVVKRNGGTRRAVEVVTEDQVLRERVGARGHGEPGGSVGQHPRSIVALVDAVHVRLAVPWRRQRTQSTFP